MPSSDEFLEWRENERVWIHRESGRPLISVTMAIEDAGLKPTFWQGVKNESCLQRGTSIHDAIENILKGVEPLFPESYKFHVDAFMLFLQEVAFDPIAVEERKWNLPLGLVGKPDIYCLLNSEPAIIDVKSGQKEAWHGLQTAGYAILCNPEVYPKRYDLYLTPQRKTKPYELVPKEDLDDFPAFLSALHIAHWKRTHGGRK